ncbi:MAG TPA: hemerythrin domain-containing protein [Gammaproteobacteria bacterium]|nr:hemerythrin domain-containing protein [Gammaproteobacteria bacterium]
MYTLDELKKQNQEITQLCEVLAVLVEHAHLHNNPVVCELMSRFKEKVWLHLVFEDNTLYQELARHDDEATRRVVQEFHDSARALKKRFSTYLRRWCQPEVSDSEHEDLLRESREIFNLIRNRVQYEDEHIFPLLEGAAG